MDFYFIRHGQSINNYLYATTASNVGRVADPVLTSTGERQAELMARFVAASSSPGGAASGMSERGFRITHIYCSLMERAVLTGYKLAEVLDLPLLGWLDIHETGGMFLYDEATETHLPQPGRTRSYLLEHYPRLVLPDEVTEEGWWNRPFEPKEARAPRARRVVDELLQKHPSAGDDGVVFVSHGGFFNYLMRAILGLPEREPEQELDRVWFEAYNTSITRITFDGDQRVVRYLNRADFLPDDLTT